MSAHIPADLRRIHTATADISSVCAQIDEHVMRMSRGQSHAALASRQDALDDCRKAVTEAFTDLLCALGDAGMDASLSQELGADLEAHISDAWNENIPSAWSEQRDDAEAEASEPRRAYA